MELLDRIRIHKRLIKLKRKLGGLGLYNGFNTSKSDLYILGTGPSVNLLAEENFCRVREEGYSIGLNFWTVHDFVPDCYSFEGFHNKEHNVVQKSLLERCEVIECGPALLVHRPWEYCVHDYVPEEMINKVLAYSSVGVKTKFRDIDEFNLKVRSLIRLLDNKKYKGIALNVASSLSRIISLALKEDFKRIILVGVDLNTSSSFYQEDVSYFEKRELPEGFNNGQKGAVHATADPLSRSYTIVDAITVLKEMALDRGVQLLIGSDMSALSDILPVYKWD